MSGSRGRANQALYLARILLDAWRRERERQDVPADTLTLAFESGVRAHLAAAYGWFLLTVARAELPPQGLPRSCAELPPVAEGKVYPPEIAEFRQLEAGGWLREMLQAPAMTPTAPRQAGNLAVAQAAVSLQELEAWRDQLERLFDRMGDSLDEY